MDTSTAHAQRGSFSESPQRSVPVSILIATFLSWTGEGAEEEAEEEDEEQEEEEEEEEAKETYWVQPLLLHRPPLPLQLGLPVLVMSLAVVEAALPALSARPRDNAAEAVVSIPYLYLLQQLELVTPLVTP